VRRIHTSTPNPQFPNAKFFSVLEVGSCDVGS
jgi:hypothetical protein